jgi:hypothetical protein
MTEKAKAYTSVTADDWVIAALDPTPRTAATARESLAGLHEAAFDLVSWLVANHREPAEQDGLIPINAALFKARQALAAAEAPGRVAALEAVIREQHRPVPYHWTYSNDRGTVCHGSTVGLHHRVERWPCDVESAIVAAENAIAVRALAAPASPAGVSGEVCAVCGEPKDNIEQHSFRQPDSHRFVLPAPAPTPTEPVERCVVAGCTDPTEPNSAFHTCEDSASMYHCLHDVYCHPFTPATRDE